MKATKRRDKLHLIYWRSVASHIALDKGLQKIRFYPVLTPCFHKRGETYLGTFNPETRTIVFATIPYDKGHTTLGTLTHEIAHALRPGASHDKKFYRLWDKLRRKYKRFQKSYL